MDPESSTAPTVDIIRPANEDSALSYSVFVGTLFAPIWCSKINCLSNNTVKCIGAVKRVMTQKGSFENSSVNTASVVWSAIAQGGSMDNERKDELVCRMGLLVVSILHWVAAGLMLWNAYSTPPSVSQESDGNAKRFASVLIGPSPDTQHQPS